MVTRRAALSASSFTDFGSLLRVLRHRARLTQRQLGIAVGYSEAQISRLEQHKRRPDPAVVAALFLPALRLGTEPELAARLHELAAAARGDRPGGRSEPAAALDQAPAAPPTVPGAHAGDLAAIPAPPSHHVEAWSLIVSDHAYAGTRAGMVLHVRVDPRRNRLLAMSPART